jgi:antagonist of KipI
MSIEVIKAGMADSFQDGGRFGYQHLGINPNGAMDLNAMKVANALVRNDLNEAVLELCFPASTLVIKKSVLIALSGANFTAEINGASIPINQTVAVPAGSEIKFKKAERDVFCYLAVHGGFKLEPWLESFSTNVKAHAGGWKGRFLKKGDVIQLKRSVPITNEFKIFPWRVNVSELYDDSNRIRIIKGNEFDWLDEKSKSELLKKSFEFTPLRDRMGYRLKGDALGTRGEEMISTAVTFGTVQLLPDGQLIILMADHQTTGGYPRVAQVIARDRSKLVQSKVDDRIHFSEVSIEEAEDLLIGQHKIINQIQVTCTARLREMT